MKLDFFRKIINFSLTILSAFFCAVIILVISAFYITIQIDSIVKETKNVAFMADNVGRLLGYAVGHLFLLIPMIYCGVAFGRFSLRLMPPNLSGKIRYSALLIFLFPILLLAFFYGTRLLYFILFNTSLQLEKSSFVSMIMFDVSVVVWCSAFVTLFIKRHLNPRAFFDQPFVLFLRRFSKFPDKVVISLILRQTSSNMPVVLPVPPRSQAGDWNPLLIGFSGMKFLQPFHSAPIIVKLPEDEWEQSIQLLIKRAQFVILDISEISEAINIELEIISQSNCWKKTIFLINDSENKNYELKQKIKLKESQIIHYRKSWIRGIPRMILGYYAVAFTFAMWVAIIGSVNNQISEILWILFGILILGWLYFSFFVRPSINKEAKNSLKIMLTGSKEGNIL